MVILVMGISGAGKTTIGRRLADELSWQFSGGDVFHPAANLEKMRGGYGWSGCMLRWSIGSAGTSRRCLPVPS